jgi:hypothetical protein
VAVPTEPATSSDNPDAVAVQADSVLPAIHSDGAHFTVSHVVLIRLLLVPVMPGEQVEPERMPVLCGSADGARNYIRQP